MSQPAPRGRPDASPSHAPRPTLTLPWLSWRAEVLALAVILSLAAYLRLAHGATNPGWYTDEGTHLDIARHLGQGQVRYLAIGESYLLFARLPLFEFALAAASRLAGEGMATLRGLTGGLGVLSVGMLYGLVRVGHEKEGRGLALLAALMLGIYPSAVLYSRFGFSYNLLAPLVLLAALGLWRYLDTRRRGWLALAAAALGLGTVSDLWMLTLLPAIALACLARRWRDALWSLPLAAGPFGLYAGLMLTVAPEAFLFDWRHTLARVPLTPLTQQAGTLADNAVTLLAQDAWMIAGVAGLLFVRPSSLKYVCLALLALPVVIIGRTTALYSLSYYYMIPLLPFVGLGLAALVRFGASWLARLWEGAPHSHPRRRWLRAGLSLALGGALASPLAASLASTLDQVRYGFATSIDPFLIDPGAAQAAARYVNERAAAEDVIIASPAVAWLIRARAADFQMAVAAEGTATAHLPADIPRERFVFDPRLGRARYVIVDNLWRDWGAVHMPAVDALLRAVENWPAVFAAGQITVYGRPAP